MKKTFLALFLLITALFVFTGCGQDLNVTIVNRSGVVPYYDEWIHMSAKTEHFDQAMYPWDSVGSDEEIDEYNSFSFKAKENDTLTVWGNGQRYVVDANGSTSLVAFTVEAVSATIYGGFPDTRDWFGAVYLDHAIIYNK